MLIGNIVVYDYLLINRNILINNLT